MENIKNFTREERKEALKALGVPAFREKQIFGWISKGAKSWLDCKNLGAGLIQKLSESFSWENVDVDLVQESTDGTKKFLLSMPDGNKVEAVFMKYSYGNSLCISTQVGCAMGCRFCASTIGGRIRNLKAWEMLGEYIACRDYAGEPINHIVLMGMGEPFDNYEEVCRFLDMIHDEEGINLSLRNITLSTCGLVPKIKQFGDEYPQVNLAISLHASSQEEREKLMPVANAYSMDELMSACREHAKKTGRRVTFEFTLIEGRNDTEETAIALSKLLKGMLCHVNLIPLNPVTETGMTGTSRKSAENFRQILESKGIPATVRRSMGRDIDAACGQLRKKNM
ncbi:MAG: 23S rRNA (adenine(2503)-C(2))-methyltransferase RlmN [Clostridia bacterium]|nr:23S rRNA (adenine(2503)-C(2))-methyltransferase RlmN [Clostridia bacterium]